MRYKSFFIFLFLPVLVFGQIRTSGSLGPFEFVSSDTVGLKTTYSCLKAAGLYIAGDAKITGDVEIDSMANLCMSFADSSVTVTIGKQDEWTQITNAWGTLFDTRNDSMNCRRSNDSLYILVDGVYNVDLRITAGGANKTNWKFTVARNDTNTMMGCVRFTSEANSYPTSAGFCQRRLYNGDILVPHIKNIDNTNDPTVICGGVRVTKIRP